MLKLENYVEAQNAEENLDHEYGKASMPQINRYVMQSVKTRRMPQNAKLSLWSHFQA